MSETILPLNLHHHPNVRRYRRAEDGKIAVLVSPDYGAGWSNWFWLSVGGPWEAHLREFMLFDAKVVRAVLNGDYVAAFSICKQRFEGLGVDPEKFYPKRKKLGVEWVDEGEEFRVDEYDGQESLVLRKILKWEKA